MPLEDWESTPAEPVVEIWPVTAPDISSPPVGEPPPPQREPFWGYTDLLLIFGLLVASTIVIGLVAGAFVVFYPRLRTDPGPLLLPTQLALYGFVYLSFRLAFGLRYGKPVLSSLGWRRANFNLAWAGLGGVLLAFALSALATVLRTPKVASPFDMLMSSRLMLVLFGILAVTIAPLFEEMFFRGFIQPLLSRSLGTVAGILVTAVLFGSLHAPEYSWAWQYALFISLAGVVFGWLRAKTNSIIPSTVMHGCFNAVSFAALMFGKNV